MPEAETPTKKQRCEDTQALKLTARGVLSNALPPAPVAAGAATGKQRAPDEVAQGANAADLAYPTLSQYLLKSRGTLEIGRGCCSMGFWWGVVHNRGDGLTCRSLEALQAFDDPEAEKGPFLWQKVAALVLKVAVLVDSLRKRSCFCPY